MRPAGARVPQQSLSIPEGHLRAAAMENTSLCGFLHPILIFAFDEITKQKTHSLAFQAVSTNPTPSVCHQNIGYSKS